MRMQIPSPLDHAAAARRSGVRGWLLITLGCLLFAQMTIPVSTQNPGLVAAYSFDEGAGTTFADSSGNGHAGSVSGATWVAGRYGTALSFDGVDDIATVEHVASLTLTTAMTVEAWVLLEEQTTPGTILVQERSANRAYALYGSKDAFRPTGEIVTSDDEKSTRGSSALSPGTWTHLAITYDGSDLRFYVNGSETRGRGAKGTLLASSDPLRIGGHGVLGEYFNGLIDDIRIYDRALSSSQIQSDMNTPVTPPVSAPDTTSPVAAITNPSADGVVSGSISVTADASDDVAVAGVQFLLDGAPLGAEDTTSPYGTGWNTASSTNAAHQLSARVRDAAGNIGLAPAVTVTVSNPPVLAFITPAQDSSIDGATVNVTYAITGDLTGVDHVRLRLDSGAEVIDGTVDGTHAITEVAEGTHVLSGYLARADLSKIAGSDAASVSFTTVLPDTAAPTVSLTSPAEGSQVSGTVTISADASDNRSVAGVQFLIDGAPLGAEDTVSPYVVSWDTTGAVNAPHQLSAQARDAAGNTAAAPAVSVTVANPPTLVIVAPAGGAQITGAIVDVAYTTSGDLTGVDHVHFRLDAQPEVMDGSMDGAYTFTEVPAGDHVLNGYLVRGDHSKIAGTDAAPVSFSTVLPDTVPPSVTITAPAEGSVLSGTVAITAEAFDNIGVTRVQFLVDGASLGAADTAPPYALSWPTSSVPNGTHTLSAIAYDAANNQSPAAAVVVSVSNTDPAAERGQWSAAMNWPLVAVHSTLLHTGEVLVWDAWEAQAAAKLWNPATNTFISVPVSAGLFCAAHSQLADGRLLVVGGHTPNGGGIPDTHVFDPRTSSWSRLPDMGFSRWYPSSTTLGDGKVMAVSGTILGTTWADTPEIYDPAANAWTSVPQINTADMHDTEYPLSFLLPDNRLALVSASLGAMRLLDVENRTWANAGSDRRLLMTSVAMYRPGRLLATGGGDPAAGSSAQPTASVIDFSQAAPAIRSIAPMAYPRYNHNLVVLADGSVLAVGGATDLSQTSSTGTLPAELWDPATETWQTMASMRDRRIYHSTALLLPDGRVLAAGGGRFSPATDFFTAEIFSPPYLFKGSRPTITSAPSTVLLNGTMVVETPEALDIATVALIRLGSVTHTLDMDQRYLELTFTAETGRLNVAGPGHTALAPPGYYMLVIKNSNGVPSVASIVRVPAPSEDVVPPSAPSNLTAVGALGTATLAWDAAVDNQSVAAYAIHRSLQSGFTPSAATIAGRTSALTYVDSGIAGTYFYKVTAEDGAGNIGLPSNEATAEIAADTTPPVVAVTAPASGDTVSGATILTAAASDDVGVAGVQFLLDGAPLEGEDVTAPYAVTWNTPGAANGAHVLSARVRDMAGNQATSAPVEVTVSNTASPNLVAAFGFNEGTGSTAFDASSQGNNGAIQNATWTTAGKYGGALSFNGTSAWVTVLDAPSLDLTTGMTLEAWVNPSALSGWRSALIKETGGGLAYALYANDNTPNPAVTINVGGDQSAVGTSSLPLNTWTHVAATFDGAQLHLYVNGVLVGTRALSGSMVVSSEPLRLGGNAVWGEYFSGLIDEVRIYNRALSVTEIVADMNAAIR